MANVTFVISNPDIDLLAKSYGYQSTIPDPQNEGQTILNPQTKGEFIKNEYIRQIKDRLMSQKRQDAILVANLSEPSIT